MPLHESNLGCQFMKGYISNLMKKNKDVIAKSAILKWVTKAILVLGLITFSGNASEFRHYNSEPTKTELNDVRWVSSKRTVSFKKILDRRNYSTSSPSNFISCLLHQDNSIAVKLKINFKELPTDVQDGFLIYYATHSSEEFDTDQLRG